MVDCQQHLIVIEYFLVLVDHANCSSTVYAYQYHCSMHFVFNTDAPNAVVVNEISADDITSEMFVIRWNSVNDIFPVTYTVRWYGEDGSSGTATVNGLSYTVTGLTANTSYNVTVVAINTCCGAGPVSNVVMVMTNNELPTLPPCITTTIIAVPSSTPSSGNIEFSC